MNNNKLLIFGLLAAAAYFLTRPQKDAKAKASGPNQYPITPKPNTSANNVNRTVAPPNANVPNLQRQAARENPGGVGIDLLPVAKAVWDFAGWAGNKIWGPKPAQDTYVYGNDTIPVGTDVSYRSTGGFPSQDRNESEPTPGDGTSADWSSYGTGFESIDRTTDLPA